MSIRGRRAGRDRFRDVAEKLQHVLKRCGIVLPQCERIPISVRSYTLTSTGHTSPSSKELIWPSGRRPLGNSERRTNSGRVRSSLRKRVNRVPLRGLTSLSPLVLYRCIPQIEHDRHIGINPCVCVSIGLLAWLQQRACPTNLHQFLRARGLLVALE